MNGELAARVRALLGDRKRRHRVFAVTGVCSVLVAFAVSATLMMPAVSMEQNAPLFEANSAVAELGTDITVKVTASAQAEEDTVFLISASAHGGALADGHVFDDEGTTLVTTADGQQLALHRVDTEKDSALQVRESDEAVVAALAEVAPPLVETEESAPESVDVEAVEEQPEERIEEQAADEAQAAEADAADAVTLEAQRAVLPQDAEDDASTSLYWFIVPRGTSVTFELSFSSDADARADETPSYGVRFYGASGASYAEAVQLLHEFKQDAAADDEQGKFFDIAWTAPVVDDAAGEGDVPDAAAGSTDDAVSDNDAAIDVDDAPIPQQELTEQTIVATQYADADKSAPSIERGVGITLSGMLPEGATASAYPIGDVQIDGMSVLAAYDIAVYNADGSLFQPAEGSPVLVTISSSALQIAEDEAIEVYHAETADNEGAVDVEDSDAPEVSDGAATSEAPETVVKEEAPEAPETVDAGVADPESADGAEVSDNPEIAAVEVREADAVEDSVQNGDASEDEDVADQASAESEPMQASDGGASPADAEGTLAYEHVGTAERRDVATVSFYATHFSPYVLAAPPLRAPGNPGTLATVDTRTVGITLNLFDYDAYDSSFANNGNSNLSSYQYLTGINSTNGNGWPSGQFRDLRFYPSGISPNPGDPYTINNYTGATPTALQGVVRPVLDNGYPHTTGFNGQHSNLSYLFDPSVSVAGKTSYADVNHLFTLDSSGYYRYDSGWGKKDSSGNIRNGNYAYYDPSQGNGGNFIVYDRTYTNDNPALGPGQPADASNDSIGFFPFNAYNEDKKTVKLNSQYNHHFGLTMSASFTIPEGKTVNGNDMVFNFSGDDDMWVFIDDVLVLDIGGIHQPVSGSINFTQGTATINENVQSVSGQSTIGKEKTIEAIFRDAGKTWDGSEYSQHTIKCFYLERGGCYSDLSLSFNLPIYNPGQIHVTKTVDGPGSAAYMDTEFKFKVFIETSEGSGQYSQYTGPVTMDDGTNVPAAAADGTYTLKSGEGFRMTVQNDKLRYYVQEIDPGSSFSTTINGQATGVNDGVIQSPTKPIGEQPEISYKNSVAGVTVSVQKEWYEQDGTVQTEGLPESVSLTLHRTWDTTEGGGTTPAPTTHRVTFRVTSLAVSNAVVSTVEDVADGGSLTFYPYAGVKSDGAADPWGIPFRVRVADGSANISSAGSMQLGAGGWATVPGYTLSNITSDVTVLLAFNQWVTVDPTRTDRVVANVTSYDKPTQPGGGSSTPGTVVHHDEVVGDPKTATGPTWRVEWNGLPVADEQGNPYTYYVDESLVPAGYVVVYENNGTTNGSGSHTGIPSGEIIVQNKRAYQLPHTGGLGIGGLMTLGAVAVLGSTGALLFSRRNLARRKRGL